MELSKRAQAIKPSPTLAVTAKAAKLKSEGKDIIGLGAGEPDFDTPQHIKDAAITAIDAGFTKYTQVGGTPGLKKAIIAKFKRDNDLDYTAKQILVSCGGKQSFFNLALATINPGDEVIIPAPYWVSYPDIVLIAEGKPVFIGTGIEDNFKITAQQLEEAITPKTRMFIINSPSNPSGSVYTIDELRALGEVIKKHPNILIVSDDMYEHILLSDDKFVNILNACPELYTRTMVLNGVSKAYAMTGWRIGYCGGPEQIITGMENIQSQSTSNPTSISQIAAEAALNGDQSCMIPMQAAFKERNQFVTYELNRIPGIRCLSAGGAFYAFADVRQAIRTCQERKLIENDSDITFSEFLLEKAGVAVVPGSAFGCKGYVRLSFATSIQNLKMAIERIGDLLR
ncbi:MAG TPA: pyridoxal phosphate-dependent aminotransferase [Nitrosomonas nitrosa]|uniref:Aminotransferase n=1 Tax=Nitrosomonas nitrosa TaxID=52442 RepID=A0A8H8YWR5_9PROT|nr:pyridoxal phosphate-dependent aminotransferase [Nitrosomonas nitrosa]MCO6434894.1 pyridoxal phosphate-dependent aminotransferase [Nitrosomonas nitrosa]PTQ91700.1 aspartate aminotransferase [Nitrosomonas nitrosa]CAE6485155.1 aspartate aminotransferase A [Nitrosomonas nitrosa]HBZ30602.1 pyridoxal phosphate-dependent aminotransferase [Nitrosomonas nitrosa]HNP52012.1 pyridoxal phosphate-dependent aminotransferase [Nitrosomonas nitrosa]